MWKHLAQFLFIQWNKSDQNSALWYALWWQQTPFLEICVWLVSREYILSVTYYVSLSGLIQKGKRDTEQRKFALPTSLPEAQLHVPISSRVLFTVDPSYNSWPHSYSFGGSKHLSCVCVTRILLILFNKVTGIGRSNSFRGTTDLYYISLPFLSKDEISSYSVSADTDKINGPPCKKDACISLPQFQALPLAIPPLEVFVHTQKTDHNLSNKGQQLCCPGHSSPEVHVTWCFGVGNPASSSASFELKMGVFVPTGGPGCCCYPAYAEVLVDVCLGMNGVLVWWLDLNLSGSDCFQLLSG